MNDNSLSAGQQALVDALARLDDLDLRGAEPAVAFDAAAWTGVPAPNLDLAALAAASDDAPGAAATAGTPSVARREAAPDNPEGSVPPPCDGVVEICARVNAGDVSAVDVLEDTLCRVKALNPRLNAIVRTTPERARAEAATVADVVAAGERPRPLAGVPLVHKDIINTRDTHTTAGSELLRHNVPRSDATVVARLANAGTLMVGKANTHEFATGATGTVSCFGPARNPWNVDCIAGGSSSGSAAALAAGLVAAATGTDTGGSIRVPAACCGVVGLKPTYGRVSRNGVFPFAWGLDHVGPMARRVADAATLLTAMAGRDPFDPTSADAVAEDFSRDLGHGVTGLRFAIPDFRFLELATSPVAEAVVEAGRIFEELGARKVDIEGPEELALVGPAAIALFLAEGGAVHRDTLRSHPEKYCEETRAFLGLAERVSAHAYLQAQRLRAALADGFARIFQGTDLLLTPTLPITAPRLDQRQVDGADGLMDVRAALTLFTRPFNLTGLPALSMPCGFADGLPIGLQIVGRPFDEARLLGAAHAYEDAVGWHERRPERFA